MFGLDVLIKWRNSAIVKQSLTLVVLSSLAGALIILLTGPDAEASPINMLPSGKQLLLEAIQHAPAQVSDSASVHEVWHIRLKNLSWPTKTSFDTYWQRQIQNSTIDLDLMANLSQEKAQIQFSIFNQAHSHAQKGFVWLSRSQAIVNTSDLAPFVALSKHGAIRHPKYLITGPEQASQVQSFWSIIKQTDPALNDGKTKAALRLLTLVLEAMPDQCVRRVGLAGVALQFNEQTFENIMRSEIHALNMNRRVLKTTLKNSPPLDDEKLLRPFYSGEVHIEPTYWLFSKNLLTGKVTQSFEGGITFHQATGLWGTIRYHRLNFGPASDTINLPKVTADNSETYAEMEES